MVAYFEAALVVWGPVRRSRGRCKDLGKPWEIFVLFVGGPGAVLGQYCVILSPAGAARKRRPQANRTASRAFQRGNQIQRTLHTFSVVFGFSEAALKAFWGPRKGLPGIWVPSWSLFGAGENPGGRPCVAAKPPEAGRGGPPIDGRGHRLRAKPRCNEGRPAVRARTAIKKAYISGQTPLAVEAMVGQTRVQRGPRPPPGQT